MRTMLKLTQTKQPLIGSRGRLFNWFKRGLLGLLIALIVLTASRAIYCIGPTGTGPDNPTFILEAGLGVPSSVWAWIQPGIAQMVRVCAYDRAGLGWSEPSASARDAQHIADELHTLLQNARVAGPYPTEVAGIVLLDSSSPDQCTSTPTGEAQCRNTRRIYRIAPALARIDVWRAIISLPQGVRSDRIWANCLTNRTDYSILLFS